MLTRVNQKRSKDQGKNMSCGRPLKFDQWKKIKKFDYGLFTNLPRMIVTCDFSPSPFKLERGILPILTK